MLRKTLLVTAALTLTLGTGLARADHDELGYVIGGVLLGAAIGELAHRHSDHHVSQVHVGYGYPIYRDVPRAYVRHGYVSHRHYRTPVRRHGYREDRKHRRHGHH